MNRSRDAQHKATWRYGAILGVIASGGAQSGFEGLT